MLELALRFGCYKTQRSEGDLDPWDVDVIAVIDGFP